MLRLSRSDRIANSLTTADENMTLSASRSSVRVTEQQPIGLAGSDRMNTTVRDVKAARRDIFPPPNVAAKASSSSVHMVRLLKVKRSIEAFQTRDMLLYRAISGRKARRFRLPVLGPC
jgi:hypothetical protein